MSKNDEIMSENSKKSGRKGFEQAKEKRVNKISFPDADKVLINSNQPTMATI